MFQRKKMGGEAPALPQGPRKAIVVPKPRNGQRRRAAEPDPAHAIVDWRPLINYLPERGTSSRRAGTRALPDLHPAESKVRLRA